ncbi:hypothetical protein RclHR1_18920002 [Rhizophagus clarus]|nr:hypothetical protein RclHR1_18920002 [Rhizophagus clarus]
MVAEHFQNCAQSTNQRNIIPPEWKEEYKLIDNIDEQIYTSLTQPIILKELQIAVLESPKRKAYGLINIIYKDLQILLPLIQKQLPDLFNSILQMQQILKDWLKANIYLILKPKL